MSLNEKLKKFLPGLREKVLLKDYATFRIGGPADFFYPADKEEDFLKAVKVSRELEVPFFILGKGSNVLFADEGFRGLIIRNNVTGMKLVRRLKSGSKKEREGSAHYAPAHPQKYLQFADLDYAQEPFDTEIEVHSGTSLQHLIQWLLENGLCGLQWFAGIPGSIGGGVIYNIHGGTKLLSDYIKDVTVLDVRNHLRKIKKEETNFAYDFSQIQKEKAIVLKTSLLFSRGDLGKAKFVYREWFRRKLKVQPQTNCPGSVFKNFSPAQAKKVGAPTPSAGWFIDQCRLKGKTVGGVQVSEKHANFIVNLGSGKSGDVRKLIKIIKGKVKKKFGLALREEILILPPRKKLF
ncbi:MAG: UDP-N-acetylmuramate dehydrogenase [Candidatus Nealsonbacteria bacterium]|nr:UDP-N-acetylmuramate dehydrogenase [Candidatus Nealsonbacteria bacterium]